jgi:hypothetical protein
VSTSDAHGCRSTAGVTSTRGPDACCTGTARLRRGSPATGGNASTASAPDEVTGEPPSTVTSAGSRPSGSGRRACRGNGTGGGSGSRVGRTWGDGRRTGCDTCWRTGCDTCWRTGCDTCWRTGCDAGWGTGWGTGWDTGWRRGGIGSGGGGGAAGRGWGTTGRIPGPVASTARAGAAGPAATGRGAAGRGARGLGDGAAGAASSRTEYGQTFPPPGLFPWRSPWRSP